LKDHANAVISLSVRIAGSNELKSMRFHQWPSSDCVITHDLLDQSNILRRVGLVKEQNGLHAWELSTIVLSMCHRLTDLALNVTGCRPSVHLKFAR